MANHGNIKNLLDGNPVGAKLFELGNERHKVSLNCVNEDDLCPIECEIVGRSFLVYDDYLEESASKFEGRY